MQRPRSRALTSISHDKGQPQQTLASAELSPLAEAPEPPSLGPWGGFGLVDWTERCSCAASPPVSPPAPSGSCLARP